MSFDLKVQDGDTAHRESVQTKVDESFESMDASRVEASNSIARCRSGFVLRHFRWCKTLLLSPWKEHRAHDQSNPRSWHPTWLRFGPLSGIFTMFLALSSIFASLGILVGSDGAPVDSWSAPPSTYLAIFTALANLSMRYAALQGVIIAWWLRASKGSTLSKLHWDWRSGTTVRGALTAGRHTGLLALACIFSTIVVADGPLLQRASTVVAAAIVDHPVSLNVSMSPEVPREYSGWWVPKSPTLASYNGRLSNDRSFNATMPANTANGTTSNFRKVVARTRLGDITAGWYDNHPLKGVVRGCPKEQNCRATIRAPALFAQKCTTHTLPLNLKSPVNETALYNNDYAPRLDQDLFLISTGILPGTREAINLITGFGTTHNCEGVLNYSICTLVSSIGEYDILMHGERILMNELKPPKIVALANNSASGEEYDSTWGGYTSTLAGILDVFVDQWGCGVAYWVEPDGAVQGISISASDRYLDYYGGLQDGLCPNWKGPLDDALLSLNNYMFRTGAKAARESAERLQPFLDPGLVDTVNTTIMGEIVGHHPVFQCHYWYFVDATLVELICIAFVLPTYWGWWRIGRPVSFSPLELAKSFQAPLLEEYNTNSTGRDLASATGDMSVMYGVTSSQSTVERHRLAFGASKEITRPAKGDVFK